MYLHLALAFLALACTWCTLIASGGIQDVMNTERPYKIDLTGIAPLDDFWNQDAYVHAVLTMRSPPDGIERATMAMLLSDMAVVLFFFLVSQRRRNSGGSLAHCVSFLLLVALNEMSSAVALPLYSLLLAERNVPKNMELTSRDVMVDFMAVLMGFGLPCWLSFDPFEHGQDAQYGWNMAVCIFPHLITVLRIGGDALLALTTFVPARQRKPRVERYYLVLGILACSVHAWTLLRVYRAGILSELLLPNFRPHELKDKLYLFMHADHIFTVLWILVMSWGVLREDTSQWAIFNAVFVVVGSILVGPGAVVAGVLMHQERRRARRA